MTGAGQGGARQGGAGEGSAASVHRKMVRGAAWMLLLKFTERSLGFISTLILVRLLSPADFGMVAMAIAFIAMAEMLTTFGFDLALIQNQRATDEHFNTAWTCNVLLGAGITVLMLALAVPIAHFYNNPAVTAVVCALALGPLITGFENIGVVAFRKELQFRQDFLFMVSKKVVSFAVTIPLAFLWADYWALVVGILVSKLTGTAMSYRAHPFRPRFTLSRFGALLHFSKWVVVNNALAFFKDRSADLLIGRWWGPSSLGLYSLSNEFANLPLSEVAAPAFRVLVPGFAKMQDDPAAVRTAFDHALSLLALVAIPAGAGIFAVAPYLVPVVLGHKWMAATPVLQILAFNSVLLTFHLIVNGVLVAKGRPDAVAALLAVYLALFLALLAASGHDGGVVGAAEAVLTASLAATPGYIYALWRQTGVPLSQWAQALFRPALAATLMVLAMRAFMPPYVPPVPTLHAGLWMLAGVLMGAAVYSLSILVLWTAMGRPAGAERLILDQLRRSAEHRWARLKLRFSN